MKYLSVSCPCKLTGKCCGDRDPFKQFIFLNQDCIFFALEKLAKKNTNLFDMPDFLSANNVICLIITSQTVEIGILEIHSNMEIKIIN
jgi:hypothetical protein